MHMQLHTSMNRHCNTTTDKFRCFKQSSNNCTNGNISWIGPIVCNSRRGWYPTAILHHKNGTCVPKNFQAASLGPFIRQIETIIKSPYTSFSYKTRNNKCADGGFRCKMGNCIPYNDVCNGIPGCRHKDDEMDSICKADRRLSCPLEKSCGCNVDQLRCANGKCIDKTLFCDRTDDCGDMSDEPSACTCRNYLSLAHPERICDGTIHCKDRSDELWCPYSSHSFRCQKNMNSSSYISKYLVCDGVQHCLRGEDEKGCLLLQPFPNSWNRGEVLSRSYGILHSGCFPARVPKSQLELICEQLGFGASGAMQINHDNVDVTQSEAGSRPAERPLVAGFNTVWIHRSNTTRIRIGLRAGNAEPFVTFQQDADCHKLFIECM